jgi:hypothetical protein
MYNVDNVMAQEENLQVIALDVQEEDVWWLLHLKKIVIGAVGEVHNLPRTARVVEDADGLWN